MARRPRLKPWRPAFKLAGVAAVVLLVHAIVLEWLAGQQLQASVLRRVAEPMFTRVLLPEAPPPAPEPAAAPAAPPRPAITALTATPSTPEGTATAVAKAETRRKQDRENKEAEKAAAAPAPDAGDAKAAEPPAEATELAEPTSPEAPEAPPPTETPAVAAAPAEPAPSQALPDALDTWPSDSRLSYQLTGQFRGGPLYGDAQVQWQRQGPLYQARVLLDISLAGSRVMTSQGDVTPGGLRPRVYEEARGSRLRGVHLNEREIVLSDGRTLPRPEGVQDTASQFVELGHRFATGREALVVGRQVSLWLARPGGLDLWTYDIVGRERLRTPRYGEVEAFRLTPRPLANPRGNVTAEIWFAPTLQYLPVRIRVSMGEEAWVDLLVETIEQR